MTLILTYVQPDAVVQVSDMRLTRRGGSPEREDETRKLISYAAHGAQLVVSYTGLAAVWEAGQPYRTLERWLAESISSDAHLRTDELLNRTFRRLAAAIADTQGARRLESADARVSVQFAGFADNTGLPLVLNMSNWQGLGHELNARAGGQISVIPARMDVPQGVFRMEWSNYQGPSPSILLHGDVAAVTKEVARGLIDCLRMVKRANRDLKGVRECLLRAIRSAADHSQENTISRDCWSAILRRGSIVEQLECHFEKPRSRSVDPIFIGATGRMESVTHIPNTPSVEAYKERLRTGEANVELNPESLKAAIDISPFLDQVAGLFTASGHDVTYGSVFDTLGMFRLAGVEVADQVESHLSLARLWAQAFFQAYISDSDRNPPIQGLVTKFSIARETLAELLLVGINPIRLPASTLQEQFGIPFPTRIHQLVSATRRTEQG